MAVNALQLHDLEELVTERKEAFQVSSLEAANWALRKLDAYQAQKAEFEELAQKEIERIQNWLESEIKKIQPDIDYFIAVLTDYHARELKENPKQKTISTPYGRLKSTAHKDAPTLTDEEALLNYLKENAPEYVKVVEKPAWGKLKKSLLVYQDENGFKVIDQAGYPVPGVSVEPAHTKFTVEVSEK